MKVLILSASTGGGHMKAADALKKYITDNREDYTVEVVDTLLYISPLLNKTVTEGYFHMITKTPKMFSIIYNSSNKENKFSSLVLSLNNQFSKKLMPLLFQFKPDVIITTHPFPTEMVSNLKGVGLFKIPLVCVMTDYAPHKTWINEHVDAYVVASENMIKPMQQMGADITKIYPFGIPISASFYVKCNKQKLLSDMNLDPELPTILIMAGSLGVTHILSIYDSLMQIDVEFQVIVITGRNRKLYNAFCRKLSKSEYKEDGSKLKFFPRAKRLVRMTRTESKPTRLIFFTNEVHKYMCTADLIITKPGGLTVSEALASDLPMAIFNAIPGQEEENADFLVKNNMAVRIGRGSSCKSTIEELLTNKDVLEMMKESCKSFDKSQSNKNIFMLLREMVRATTEDIQ